jgi:phosphohistidine swiveling domain-containing protein
MSAAAAGDPFHKPGLPQTHWTTDNVGEALPGVATPLGWTIWESGSDRMCRDLSYALGVFTAQERDGPAPGQDPIITIFHGRIAMCMEWLGVLGDRMPGTTGPEAIGSMLGRVPETMTFAPTKRRYPVIAAKLPVAALRSPARIRALAAEIEPWWQAQVAVIPDAEEEQARAALRDAAARFRHAMTVHGIGLFAIITPLIQALTALVETTGVGDVGRLSGTGGAEMAIVEDIWRASRGQLTEAEVAKRHGFHGPREGELSSRVWEDPTPLTRMIAAYADKPESDDPVKRDARLRQELPGLQAEHAALRLPASWGGTPDPEPVSAADSDGASTITGIPASAGIVEGTVRVVADPSFAEVEPGEILVSRTTDPSWALIMFVFAALVVDIGGVVSHAAVVARELGIRAWSIPVGARTC